MGHESETRASTMSTAPQLPAQFHLIELDRVDDVMREATRRAGDGAEEGTLIWANEQSAARTPGGHSWFSPPGNLHCSLILRPDFANARCGELAYVTALSAGSALAELLSPMTGLRYRWPTDILINDLRAGRASLAASGAGSDPYEWLALGVAINVERHPTNPEPEEFNSVHASGAPEVTVAELLEGFARYFLNWINRWAEDGFEPILRQWQMRADGIGEAISVQLDGGPVSGIFVEVDTQGRLVVGGTQRGARTVSVNEYFRLDGR